MKKLLFLMLLMLCCIGIAFAKPVGPDQAKKAALTYIKKAVPAYAKLSAERLVDITSTTPFREFYVFSIDQKGFILVSGDNNVVPILGYSTSGNFPGENMPDNFRGWLQGYEREIAYIREHSVAESEELNSQWRQLLEDDAPDFEVIIEPLITTTWKQTAYYNNACPLDANAPSSCNGHVPAGPVAVAVGQILNYYRWPEYLPGHTYTHSTYGTLSTDRSYVPYYNMPNQLDASSSTDQVDAVSNFLHNIGVFLETNYGPSGSSANLYVSDTHYPSAYKLLEDYCDYIWVGRIQKSSYSNSSWISNMTQQLWNEMPVLYSGSGSGTASGSHVFILDGYTSDDQFHINWGWGGQCDGYYTIGSLNPSDYDFNSGNYALVDIRPPMHNFTVSVNPQGAGQVVGTQNGQHPSGYQYEVAVEPTEGYRVLNMTINGIDDEYYAHTLNTLTEDVHITYNLAPVDASDHYYYCTFNEGETENWVLVNGNQTNKWCFGNATSSEWYGTSLYISADNGVTQSYDTGARSYVWAYHEMTVPAGRYFVQYYWQCIGEHHPSYDYDYMRVFLVPANVTLTAGVIPNNVGTAQFSYWTPDGWINLNGTSPLNNYLGGGWERFSDEIEVPVSGDYKLVVVWINDATQGLQPPAAIDRITFRPVTRTITVIPEYDLFDNTYYGGEVTNSGEYYAGNTCTLHATPWDRTVFRGWYDGDGQLLSSAPTYSFTVTDNDTMYAHFEHNSSYYSCIFHPRDTSDWVFVNGNQTNKWCFGQAASLWDDGYGLYISNDNGVNNAYNTNAGSIVYAYLKQPLPAGDFHFSCGWRANGENNYDYMRIFVAPVTDTLIAGVFPDGTTSCYNFSETIPDGWTQLGSTPNFNGDTLWYDYSCDMHIYNGWGYRLVFVWCNDNSVGSQPPAAVGRVRFEPIQYTVAASALPANAGTVLDTGTFTSGYYCTLTAVSAPGYRFAGWKNLTYNVMESTDSVYSFNVWRNENLQAIFVPTNPINYWCYFGTTGQDDTTGWVLVNDGQTNQWCIGNATAVDNNRSLYISNDNGVSNAYDNGSISISWAYREFDLIAGTYEMSYYWKAQGESAFDWLRAFLVPDEYSLVAGQFNGNNYSSLDRDVLPAGWISLCGPDKLNLQSDWQRYAEDVEVTTAGRYKLAFMWANDGSSGSQPPAAVDNIQLNLPTCRKVTGVTVSNVTTYSIDAEWNANDLATSWHVNINLPNGGNTVFYNLVSSPSCHITGLSPNTDYELVITPICSSSGTGQSLFIPVHTACSSIDLPYTQDFENEVTGSSTNSSFAECWHRLNNATTYFGIPYISGTSTYNHTYNGSKGLYWNNSTSTSFSDYQAITLPSINIYTYPTNTLQLYFWARRISGAPVIKVGVMSNPDDITTFTLIDTVNLSPDQAWHEYVVSLENYTGSGEFVALRADRPESGSWIVYLDDITLEQRPACPRVENIAAQNITASSANLAWTEQGSATSWTVSYLPEGGSPSDAVTLNSYNSNITITGLDPNTIYTVQITPVCSSGLGGTNQTIFRTNCTGLDNLPYTMNFEESEGVTSGSSTSTAFVECWHRLNNATVYYGYPYVSSSYNHTDGGSQGLYWYSTTQNESYGNYHAAVLPGVNTTIYPVNTLQLSFWAKTNTTSNNNIQVGVMTDPNDIATFSSWKTITLNLDNEWHEYTCSFEGYTGSGAFVALRADTVPSGSNSRTIYMDDFTLEVIPQCGSPRDLLLNNVTTTSATISWTPSRLSHNNFVVAYGTGTDPSTMATVSATGTSTTLTGLSDGTQYNVFVKTVCGSGLESEWSNIISFSTITIPYVITQSNPYIERFEGSTKWQLINDQTNKWTIGNATNNGGTKALYISDNMGTTNTYTISNLQWSYAVKTFDFPAGSVYFSFDWKSYGERNYDYLRVFLVPTSKQLLPHISPNGQSPNAFNSTIPEGWIALDGGSQLSKDSTWSTIIDTVVFDAASTYNMVFIWCNDGSAGTQPPAAIDNIIITTDAVACSPITPADLPYTENFDSYTTSTTAKTGVSVPCWTLAHQDVAMTDEYKPMVYYSSANAHSGSYSLILNKRGIFVMPEFDGDVSRLQLSFYVKQSMAKYQLQVGVMSDLSNASTFVPIATINNSSTTASVLQTVDFASYSGPGRYIAFRNILASGYSGDFSLNYIDDISLELRPASCPAISAADLPYSDNFDSYTTSTTAKTGVAPDCWTLAHQDVTMTDEYKPMVYYASANAHSGSYSLILNKRGIFAMPEFDGDVSTLQLSFYVKQSMAKYQLQVGVMSDLTNASTFVPVATINNSSTSASVLQTVDFASYSGSGRYIAFRNVLASGYSGDFSLNYIDDISLELRPASCPAISAADLPYSDNFDSYTTSTTAKTGVAPDCWTLAHQDVAMTDEYKPMVYYASANAHSGSYSLILNKRGIFAMPEFDGDVSTLQLSFYLKQTQAKFRLQVGVMSDLSNASTFVPVATINNSSTSASVLQTVDFASYSGSGRYIAFRNVLASGYSGDFSCNYIDDISLELRPSSCPAISAADLPYSDNFDSYTTSTTAKTGVEPDCWTLARQDVAMTDEYKPMVYYSSANAHSGSYSIILNKRGIYAMPEFDGDLSTLQLSFYVRQSATKYQLQVGVMNSLSNADSFTPVTTINNSSTGSEFVTVDFSDYTGTGHYIAFRNILAPGYSGDFSLNYIDDISLELRPSSCPAISAADLPYSDNFDSYTTSTTAKTGVEPDCWTLAHQDVAMTDDYKPMVYYSSANAHSGSYSLILNKRGIYAMPEFDGDVSTLQLSFFVRQSATKYQLQVGVMNSLSNADSFTPVTTINNSSTGSEFVTVDFSDYTGTGHYIAFRNILAPGYSGDFSLNYIDDIRLETRCAIYPDELPYSDNFDSYTTSTTAKTGVTPDCWTLAHQDVTMADVYKPMVYHDASCAHSGNYSLILNKRGIFAMPEFGGDVSILQLSFYVRQSAAKYQLQVGVMSDLSNASTFVPVATINNSSTSASVLQTVSFSSYSGSGRYIAFRNILAPGYSGDFSLNYIDDITLSLAASKGLEGNGNDISDNESISQKWMTVFPNPTSGMITIEADGEIERIDIFDYTGRCVATVEHQSSVDLSGFATGLYTLRCTLPDRIEVRRVVKQ